jgi:hypothetical protein
MEEGGQQLPAREIAGRAEDDKEMRLNAPFLHEQDPFSPCG